MSLPGARELQKVTAGQNPFLGSPLLQLKPETVTVQGGGTGCGWILALEPNYSRPPCDCPSFFTLFFHRFYSLHHTIAARASSVLS